MPDRVLVVARVMNHRAVGFGGRVVDGLTIAGIGVRQHVKQSTPDPAHRPVAKAIVDRRRGPVDGRAILPPTAHFQNDSSL